jgi:hypothetical protein
VKGVDWTHEIFERESELFHRFRIGVLDVEIEQGVVELATHQILEREVVSAFDFLLSVVKLSRVPILEETVSSRQRDSLEQCRFVGVPRLSRKGAAEYSDDVRRDGVGVFRETFVVRCDSSFPSGRISREDLHAGYKRHCQRSFRSLLPLLTRRSCAIREQWREDLGKLTSVRVFVPSGMNPTGHDNDESQGSRSATRERSRTGSSALSDGKSIKRGQLKEDRGETKYASDSPCASEVVAFRKD